MTDKVSGVLHVRAMNVSGDDQFEISGTGGVTLAYSVQPDGSVKVATALCSLDDHFNRGKGSKVAIGRLQCARPGKYVLVDASTVGFLAKEMFGIDEVPAPKVGRNGEYFWHDTDLPLSKLLMQSVKSGATELLEIWLRRNKLRTPEPLPEEAVQIVHTGKTLAFAFHPTPLEGVEAVA